MKIKGKISGTNTPPMVYLNVFKHDGEIRTIDSSKVKNGSFTLHCRTTRKEVGLIRFSNRSTYPVIIEKGIIRITICNKDQNNITISGTPLNEQLSNFNIQYLPLWASTDRAISKFNALPLSGIPNSQKKEILRKEAIAKYNAMTAYAKHFIAVNKKNIVSIAALCFIHKGLTPADYKSLYSSISFDYKYSGLLKIMQEKANGKVP